jgi:hypothetical protein
MEMKYEEISSEFFLGALQKLVRAPLPVKTAYQVKKWADEMNKARTAIVLAYKLDIAKRFGKMDESGNVIFAEDGSFDVPEELKEEFFKAQKEFGEKLFKFERYKIWIHELNEVKGISAQELNALMPLLSEEPHHAQVHQIQG